MKLLLDTHVLIWFLDDHDRIPNNVKQMIINPQNERYISIVSFWEIAVKINIKKLELNCTLYDLMKIIEAKDFKILPIKIEHLIKHITLPYLHKCPFDRLLISTTLSENLHIITSDDKIHKYDVNWLW